MLQVSDIKVSFQSVTILKSVSVHIEPGAVTIVLGPSGCGKTTLLRTLAFLERFQEGWLELDGMRYTPDSARDPVNLWPKISPVFQQHFLWPHLTVKDNIFLGTVELARRGWPIDASYVQTLELEEFLDRFPNELSVGQRQRVALARACVRSPRYLLLDEVTSSLDIKSIAVVSDILLELLVKRVGLLIVSHHIGFVRRMIRQNSHCSVLFMENGVVAEEGGGAMLDQPKTESFSNFLTFS